ncbi:MAG: radical SAM protein [Spirosomataceae bacterium]
MQPKNNTTILSEIADVVRVFKLYIQLLYRCNFNCKHCFHGEKLKLHNAFSKQEVINIASLFREDYSTELITFLGGEPFIHPEFPEILEWAQQNQFVTEVVTNGYKVGGKLVAMHKYINHLRVSIEGLEASNDFVRKKGSFGEAIKTLMIASQLGVKTSVTLTVNQYNLNEVVPLGKLLKEYGVSALKLHRIREIGNAAENRNLLVNEEIDYKRLIENIMLHKAEMVQVILDEDLDSSNAANIQNGEKRIETELERVEVEPNGALYISCKAVGNNCNAFVFNELRNKILYRPKENDEVANPVKQVFYSNT